MRIVIDTSVVISAALRDRTPQVVIDWIVRQPGWEWVATQAVVNEYIEVLKRPKFGLTQAQMDVWSLLVRENVTLIATDLELEFPRDQQDVKFLVCAIAADAKYLLTGDKDFQDARQFEQITIISPTMFLKLVM
jgi:uncharacterized protein